MRVEIHVSSILRLLKRLAGPCARVLPIGSWLGISAQFQRPLLKTATDGSWPRV